MGTMLVPPYKNRIFVINTRTIPKIISKSASWYKKLPMVLRYAADTLKTLFPYIWWLTWQHWGYISTTKRTDPSYHDYWYILMEMYFWSELCPVRGEDLVLGTFWMIVDRWDSNGTIFKFSSDCDEVYLSMLQNYYKIA